jgi:hypothetical protein
MYTALIWTLFEYFSCNWLGKKCDVTDVWTPMGKCFRVAPSSLDDAVVTAVGKSIIIDISNIHTRTQRVKANMSMGNMECIHPKDAKKIVSDKKDFFEKRKLQPVPDYNRSTVNTCLGPGGPRKKHDEGPPYISETPQEPSRVPSRHRGGPIWPPCFGPRPP